MFSAGQSCLNIEVLYHYSIVAFFTIIISKIVFLTNNFYIYKEPVFIWINLDAISTFVGLDFKQFDVLWTTETFYRLRTKN